MRKLFFSALLCFTLIGQSLNAQYYFFNDKYYEKDVVLDLGASFGIMNCITDLGATKSRGLKTFTNLNWKDAKASAGAYIMAMYQHKIGLRLEASFGEVNGADSSLRKIKGSSDGRYESNLSFKSNITDLQLAVEVHPLMFLKYDDKEPPRLSPYTFIGAGYYSFDPQAKLNGQWFSLQPLRTEGQGFKEHPDRKPYKLNQFNISTGLGLKYEIGSLVNARLEFNYRFLFTDYLDDVSTTYINPSLYQDYMSPKLAALAQKLQSRKAELTPGAVTNPGDQRGSPKSNDSFFTIQLKIGVVIGRPKR